MLSISDGQVASFLYTDLRLFVICRQYKLHLERHGLTTVVHGLKTASLGDSAFLGAFYTWQIVGYNVFV